MSTTTTNIGLTKPASNENVSLSVLNDNWDAIDNYITDPEGLAQSLATNTLYNSTEDFINGICWGYGGESFYRFGGIYDVDNKGYDTTTEIAVIDCEYNPDGVQTTYSIYNGISIDNDAEDDSGYYIATEITNGSDTYKMLPTFPSNDGTYYLKLVIDGGSKTLSWESVS